MSHCLAEPIEIFKFVIFLSCGHLAVVPKHSCDPIWQPQAWFSEILSILREFRRTLEDAVISETSIGLEYPSHHFICLNRWSCLAKSLLIFGHFSGPVPHVFSGDIKPPALILWQRHSLIWCHCFVCILINNFVWGQKHRVHTDCILVMWTILQWHGP